MQSIVVYRNPLEAAIWEGLMGGGWMFIVVLIVATLAGVWVYTAIEASYRRHRHTYTFSSKKTPNTWFYTVYRHNGKIATAVTIGLLILAHVANMRGWW
jgi:hypothetical protein